MDQPIVQELGTYRGRRYFLHAEAEPDYADPTDFVVTVYYRTAETRSNVEVARIDTEHGYVHFDQLYREHQPTKPYDGNLWDAIEFLTDNWLGYARRYWENHDA